MKSTIAIAILSLSFASGARAELADELAAVQTRWADIQYATPPNQQAAAFEALQKEAAKLRTQYPDRAEPLIWEGIVYSTWAGAKGGMGALSLCKKARADFEAAIAIDGTALGGSAYTSLGSLYYQVPGWPIGFGDDEKAAELLQQGLKVSPDGIDANYFWGDYLLDQERYQEAVTAFERAAAAAPRPGRESADAGRQREIADKLKEARAELSS
jgi:tetratricopeptide (TPR) repeat protein